MRLFKLVQLVMLVGFLLKIQACAGGMHESKMQGMLIKNRSIKTFYEDKGYWQSTLSQLDDSGPEIAVMIAAIESKKWLKAVELAKNHLKKKPYHSGSFLVLATAYSGLGRHDAASYVANIILRKNENHAAALNILGLSSYAKATMLEDYRQAQSLFRRAFDLSSREVAAGLNLGYLFLEMGDSKQAQSTFKLVSSRCSQCEEADLGLAIALSRQGQHIEAKKKLEKIVNKNPKSMTAWYHLALHSRNVEHDPQAADVYAQKILQEQDFSDLEIVEKARQLSVQVEDSKL